MTRRLLALACVALGLPLAACSTEAPGVPRQSLGGETDQGDAPQEVAQASRGSSPAGAQTKQQAKDTPMDLSQLVAGGNRFALDLYEQLRASEGNLFFSPGSISVALGMTYAGAEGQTEREMAETLHFDMPEPGLHDAMQTLLAHWETRGDEEGFRLQVANRLWGQEGYKFLPAFLQVTRTKYGAELARLDFAEATEQARKTINGWVEEQTEEKITDLLPAGALPRDCRLVLTNAVYFKGDWTEPFDEKQTKEEDFHVTATEKVQAPLMHQKADFRYATADGLQVLELPYGDESLSMLVLLPEKTDGLAELEAELTYEGLQRWTSALRSREVEVYLPRFTTTDQFELNDALKRMGMPSAFDPSAADFSGMTGGRDLFVSKVVHKAFVDVNEEGTEAAAATGTVMAPTAMPVRKPTPVFRADHPFLFLIRDSRNGALLFLGRLVDPSP